MSVLFQLAINNIRRYKRESFLVVVSVALMISLITLASALMSSLYASYVMESIANNPFNAQIYKINDVKKFLEDIGEENLDYYEIQDSSEYASIEDPNGVDQGIWVLNFHSFANGENLPENITKRYELREGRMSSSVREIVVPTYSKCEIGDTLVVSTQSESYETTVVGKTAHSMYYYKDNRIFDKKQNDEIGAEISLIFKDGTKNIETLVQSAMTKQNSENIYVEYNLDYNFLKGMQNKPGSQLYNFIFIGLVFIIIISFMTMTLILNALNTSFSQKDQTFGILRSVGTTKTQMKLMIMFEGLLLASVGIAAGLLVGTLMMDALMTYLKNTILSIDAVSYGVNDSVWLIYYFPKSLVIIITFISFVIVGVALLKKTRELYKHSAVEMNRQINVRKKKNLSIKGNPIFSLAKINNKLTRNMKGIKTTMIISVVVLIVINSWLATALHASYSVSENYDTRIYSYEYGEGIEEDVLSIFNTLNDVEGICDILTFYDSRDVFVDFSKHKLKDESVEFNPLFTEGFSIVVIDDTSFEKVKNAHGMDTKDNVLLVNSFSSYNTETLQQNPERASLAIQDGDSLNVEIISYGGMSKSFELKIDTVVDSLDNRIEFVDPKRGSVLISQDYYNKHFSDDVNLNTVSIMLDTDMGIDNLKKLYADIEDLDLNSDFDVYSNLEAQYIREVVETTTQIISIVLFTYISFIILINIINVTLTDFRKRKRDHAILRSVGADIKDIKKMILYETLLTVFKAWLIGMVIGNVLAFALNVLLSINLRDYEGMTFSIDLFSNLLSLLLSIVIVIVVMISVRFETKKLDIIEDIRAY